MINAAPRIGRAPLVYRITAEHDGWNGLDVFLGCHHRLVTGRLTIAVHSSRGEVLRSNTFELNDHPDNQWLTWNFSPISDSARTVFDVAFRWIPAERGQRLSVFDSGAAQGRVERLLARAFPIRRQSALFCRTRYE